ncbi:response regulator [Rhodobacteraceae bacterium ASV31]|nr:response regulator [Anianabacter salinae]
MAVLLAAAIAAAGLAVVTDGAVRALCTGLAVSLVASILWIAARDRLQRLQDRRDLQSLLRIAALGFDPLVLTDIDGHICHANAPARDAFGEIENTPLSQVLGTRFATPGGTLRGMMASATGAGTATHEILAAESHLRLSVLASGARFLWRLELIGAVTAPEADTPLAGLCGLTADDSGRIMVANAALRRVSPTLPDTLADLVIDPPFRSGDVHLVRLGAQGVPCRIMPVAESNTGTSYVLVPAATVKSDWTVLDSLPIPVIRLWPDGLVISANAAAVALFDPGTPWPGRFPDLVEGLGRPIEEWLRDVTEGRGAGQPQVLRARTEKADQFLQVTLRPYEAEEGRALLAVLTDATELKSLEAQFVQSQKMQAIGQLAGGVAHDFNNLLTAISGHCDLLLVNRDAGDPEFGDLMQISHNANRAASLVRQLLAFSRTQTLELAALDLRDTLAEMAHLLNRLVGERIQLVQRHDPALALIRGDQRQVEQVLMNLVVNARDAMPDGGEIRIETAMRRLTQAMTRNRATVTPGDYVTVTVSDEGVGIPPDRLDQIFEPFFTTKRPGEGTGLGLSTAYGIVKQLGGFIFCDSIVGSGTRFTLYFGAHCEAAAPAAPTVVPARSPLDVPDRAGVVLLVEDEAPVRAFAARALRMHGHVVLEAGNAEDALKLLDDPAMAIDVFVTDVVMPGLDGPAWVKRALRARPDTRVIFVSGYSEETVSRQRAEIAGSVFLPKPFSLTQLTEAVAQQIT